MISEYVYSENYVNERLFYLHDHLYSVCGVTDDMGLLKEAYEYDPYGLRSVITDGPDGDSVVNFNSDDNRGTVSPLNVRASYTGQRLDLPVELYYYKNRYYNPELGRFISRDPAGYKDGMSLYQYAGYSPKNHFDPLGLTKRKYNGLNVHIIFMYGREYDHYSPPEKSQYTLKRDPGLAITGIAGTSTHDVSVDCECLCKGGGEKYKPSKCKIKHIIKVNLLPSGRYKGFDHEKLAKQAEFDHVIDYTDTWADITADGKIRNDATAKNHL